MTVGKSLVSVQELKYEWLDFFEIFMILTTNKIQVEFNMAGYLSNLIQVLAPDERGKWQNFVFGSIT